MVNRADKIAANDPELISRLSRRFGKRSPVGINMSEDGSTGEFFLTSTNSAGLKDRMNLENGTDDLPLDRSVATIETWVHGKWERNTTDSSRSDYGFLYLGADYLFTPDLVVGAILQFDRASEYDFSENHFTKGEGWLAGPYLVARITDELYFDARLAWGQSTNEVSPTGAYIDQFNTARFLARARLTGRFENGPFLLEPHFGFVYFEEEQHAYVDSLGVTIPDQTIHLGQATFGPKLTYFSILDDGTIFEPYIGFQGIWNFDKTDLVDVNTSVPLSSQGDLRARIYGGFSFEFTNGWYLAGEAFVDGIGVEQTQSYGGSVTLKIPLN